MYNNSDMHADHTIAPAFASHLIDRCASSNDPFIKSCPASVSDCFKIATGLTPEYGWRYSDAEVFGNQLDLVSDVDQMNRLIWIDQARNAEAYSVMSYWRGTELLASAITSLNGGETVSAAVLARSLLELATAFILNANTLDANFAAVDFPGGVVVSYPSEFEQAVVKMIWGTRLQDQPETVKQTNILTLIQRLSKNPKAAALLTTYEYLCEVAHPNVIGNAVYWSRINSSNDDGSVTLVISQNVHSELGLELLDKTLWSLAWASGTVAGAFGLINRSVGSLLQRIAKLSSAS